MEEELKVLHEQYDRAIRFEEEDKAQEIAALIENANNRMKKPKKSKKGKKKG